MKSHMMVLLMLGAFLVGCAQEPVTPPAQPVSEAPRDAAFVHTVFFWMNEDATEADREELYEGLNSLRGVEHIQQIFIGVPAATDREVIDSSYDYSLTMIFPDQAAQDAYQVHPVHDAFVDNYAHLWNRVVVYDAVTPER